MVGVLAPSPVCFKNSASIPSTTSRRMAETAAYDVTNYGLRINLPCVGYGNEGDQFYALLNCGRNGKTSVGILVKVLGYGRLGRVPESQLAAFDSTEVVDAEPLSMYLILNNDFQNDIKDLSDLMAISNIITDRPFHVQALAVSKVTSPSETSVNVVFEEAGKQDWAAISPIVSDMSIRNAEAVNLILHMNSLDGIPSTFESEVYSIIFGLRDGYATVHCTNDSRHRIFGQEHLKSIEQNWASYMSLDPDGSWESKGDYMQTRTSGADMILLSAKRKVVKKQRIWALTIRVWHCVCKAHYNKAEDCICDVHSRNKVHSECEVSDAASEDCICDAYQGIGFHLECFCADCRLRKDTIKQTSSGRACGCCTRSRSVLERSGLAR